jgi:hypothetical protein
MSTLQTLRQARWITRLVLVWFALFLGAAVASPIVKPASGQMVCTAMGGMKMVMDDEGQAQPASASMDCVRPSSRRPWRKTPPWSRHRPWPMRCAPYLLRTLPA